MLAAMTRSAPLADRRVLIVGASSGIGAAFALAAIGDGARVVIAARREDRLLELCEEAGGGTVVAGDATDATDARRICDRAAGELGNLDLVLYVPGIGPLNPLEHFDPDMWRRAFDVNVVLHNTAGGCPIVVENNPSFQNVFGSQDRVAVAPGVYGTDFFVETSTTLSGSWTPAILSPTSGFTVTITGNDVKFSFPAGTKDFARLKVTGP